MIRRIFFLLVMAGVMIFSMAAVFAEDIGRGKTLIYIPIDNRPVNLKQTVELAERLGYEVLVPPQIFLGTGADSSKFGNPEELWYWLNKNAHRANAAIISTDAMLYGSLVASRQHEMSVEEVLNRARNFELFHEDFPYLPIYAFGTIMRTPRSGSYSSAEPEYYKQFGEMIFNYTALKDKSETEQLTKKEQVEFTRLENEIPKEALEDWLGRRAKNYDVHQYLAELTAAGVFNYFLVGCDDSAMFSQTHLESRHLTAYGNDLDLGKTRFQVMSGADELGMLMISRAINNDLHRIPLIAIDYNIGTGANTVPTFSNEKISDSLEGAIISVGGVRIPNIENADLILSVNTFPNGKTFSSDNKINRVKPHSGIGFFIDDMKKFIKKGYAVGVVDISTSNGADNSLMRRLRDSKLQFKIRSYGGWNTASNSAGFLIGAGVLTRYMSDTDFYNLLLQRYLDDWVYQANLRTQINGGLIWTVPGEGGLWNLDGRRAGLETLTADLVKKFVNENIILPEGYTMENISVDFPWNRTFEADISFDLIKQ